MRSCRRLFLACLLLSCAQGAPTVDTAEVPGGEAIGATGWMGLVAAHLASGSRAIVAEGDGFAAALPGHEAVARFSAEGLVLGAVEAEVPLRLHLASWGGAEPAVEAVEAVEPVLGDCLSEVLPDGSCARRLEYAHEGVTAWWVGLDRGVEFGWTVDEAPAVGNSAMAELTFRMAVDGAEWMEAAGDGAEIVDAAGTTWTVSGADAWDAKGTPLRAWLDVEGEGLVVRVDARGAVYPVVVDPVLSTATTTLSGGAEGDGLGSAVSDAGDINGDGYDDVIIGVPSYSTGSITSAGTVLVFHGSAGGVESSASFTLIGSATLDRVGNSVSGIGDVNSDGFGDLVIGNGYYDNPGTTYSQEGRAFIYLGSAAGVDTSSQLKLEETSTYRFGVSVSGAGDVNGDGFDDVVIGSASGGGVGNGKICIYHGSSGGLTPSPSRTLLGTTTNLFSGVVDDAGDVNGDGYDDIILGGSGYSGSILFGRAFIYQGSSTGIVSSASRTLTGFSSTEGFGGSIAGAGDVNGDGYDDVIIGASDHFVGLITGAGAAYVYHGSSSGIGSSVSRAFYGTTEFEQLGISVSSAGDVNGDGYEDIIFGAYGASTWTGYAEIHNGSASGVSAAASLSLAGEAIDDFFGWSVSSAGDVNGDGYDDVVIGAFGWDSGALHDVGRVYVYQGYADEDGDGTYLGGDASTSQDCDDTDASVGAPSTRYVDSDGDGYGSSATVSACPGTSGTSAYSTDCDDTRAAVSPGATEVCDASNTDEDCDGSADNNDSSAAAAGKTSFYVDGDTDGYGGSTTGAFCDLPASGYTTTSTDCNDSSASIHPGATEVCDAANADEDCDSLADDLDTAATSKSTWYRDLDSDTYGGTTTTSACDQPTGYVSTTGDCNDSAVAINPGATEICDASNTDEDCDGTADNADTSASTATKSTYYVDSDADTYGSTTSAKYCDLPTGYSAVNTDCNDTAAAINPGATEICDASNSDEDCDGAADNNDTGASAATKSTYYRDVDLDTYGSTTTGAYCDLPSGYSAVSTDCNDTVAAINPGATEICDASNTDEDCDGAADNNDTSASTATKSTYYLDSDGDTYGSTTSAKYCDLPTGYSAVNTDCDDTTSTRSPGNTEVCDAANVDEDCDSLADNNDTSASAATKSTYYVDSDGDTYGSTVTGAYCDLPTGYAAVTGDCDDSRSSVSPAATEVCDAANTDEDCDGTADNNDSSAAAAGKTTYYQDSDTDGYGGTTTGAYCDLPTGYSTVTGDCNDAAVAINPGATEICDAANTDEDCDSLADNADSSASTATKSTYYLDSDGDTYGGTTSAKYCDLPTGYSAVSTDCNDTSSAINPGATEICDAANTDEDCDSLADNADSSASAATKGTYYRDSDADGYGGTTTGAYCDLPSGYSTVSTDCNDSAAAINPGATEICDAANTDEDCDSLADNNDSSASAATKSTYYLDSDGDTYGGSVSARYCDLPTGYSAVGTDCNDASASISPAATEICDSANTDEDCDGLADNNDTSASTATKTSYYVDSDGDGYGSTTSAKYCDLPSGYAALSTDCDDTRATVSPAGTEVCDASNLDEDCDGKSDDLDSSVTAGTKSTWYRDADTDGYGTISTTTAACDQPSGYVTSSTDCNDLAATISPAASEICDAANTDEDCDSKVDDADSSVLASTKGSWYTDGDGDGYGVTTAVLAACDQPTGRVALPGDCNDTSTAYNPAATDVCSDPNDYNCDGSVGYADADADGFAACEECDDNDFSIKPTGIELCDGVDNNCDGDVDEDSAADAATWYEDVDGDGYGDAALSTVACEAPTGYVASDADCDDSSIAYNPAAPESCDDPNDYNCDGAVEYADADADGFPACTECDDTDPAVSPSGVEVCDGIDNNCDGVIDEDTAVDAPTWYADADFDNFGTAAVSTVACEAPLGYVADDTDCNDADSAFYPGAAESCDETTDYNCDGSVGYADADGDGYAACLECDDSDAAVNPGAGEVCDEIDNDCDGTIDLNASDATTWYIDEDGDGHGVDTETTTACAQPDLFAPVADDCDDSDGAINPEADEVCDDSIDNNCDDLVDVEDAAACQSLDTGNSGVATEDTANDAGDGASKAGGGGNGAGCEKGGCAMASHPAEWGLLLGAVALVAARRRGVGVVG
jgi:hypothetical protein